MEGLILLGLTGVGYMMIDGEKDDTSHRIETTIRPPLQQNSNAGIYDFNPLADALQLEQQLVQDNYKQTVDPQSNMISHMDAKNKEVGHHGKIKGMDGSFIPKDQFMTNDQGVKMEPFFKGEGYANIDLDDTSQLGRLNGRTEFRYENKEARGNGVNLQGPPEKYANGNPYGMADTGPAIEQDRYIPGMYKTDEIPFEQERVPHIDRNSDINRDVGEIYAQRNSIDNTRALSNQKVSLGTRVIPGKGIDERAQEGQVFKHLPDKDYEQSPDQWLVTTGAVDAGLIRPAQILPETNRQYLNKQEVGSIAPNGQPMEEKRPMFKKTDKQQLASDTIRNAFGTDIFVDSDIQRTSYKVYPNEREVTEERTYDGNLKTVFSGETLGIQDSIKTTVKETTIGSKNPNGFTNTVTTLPEERLQDAVRTNKKETTLFEYTGGARGSTLQEMAQDQYFRADLNPNKEVISQGRPPTFESVKIANGVDTIDVEVKKIEDDYFNHRINGVTNVFQEIPTDNTCKYTRDKDTLDNDVISNRIEGDLLDPFKHNPYTHSLHSFAY